MLSKFFISVHNLLLNVPAFYTCHSKIFWKIYLTGNNLTFYRTQITIHKFKFNVYKYELMQAVESILKICINYTDRKIL
jgi:hypothetical protein